MHKNIAMVWVFLCCFSYIKAYEIVFVHIGDAMPEYIYVALEQARLFNPDIPICLITNQIVLEESKYDFGLNNVRTISCESLSRCVEHDTFLSLTPHNQTLLAGFWIKSTERFFYIYEYMNQCNVSDVVHVESDNMLYVNVHDISAALHTYKGLAAVFDADYRCIPSFVYIPNVEAIARLTSFIAAHAHLPIFDMEFIARFNNSYDDDVVDNLPLIMPEYLHQNTLKNAVKHVPDNPEPYYRACARFNSIFDGAAIGQYLGGIDSKHKRIPGFINETCVFNPSYLMYEWRIDDQGRKVPYALCEGKAYRINNLHIHSKQLDLFRS